MLIKRARDVHGAFRMVREFQPQDQAFLAHAGEDVAMAGDHLLHAFRHVVRHRLYIGDEFWPEQHLDHLVCDTAAEFSAT